MQASPAVHYSRERQGRSLWLGVLLAFIALTAFGRHAQAAAASNVTTTSSTSSTQTITTQALTQRTDAYSTEIIGKLDGVTVFDQTFNAAFSDPVVQAGAASARAAIIAAGGPTAVVSPPALTSHTQTLLSTTTATNDTIQSQTISLTTQTSIGPANIAIGDFGLCANAGATDVFPSGCSKPGIPFTVVAGGININVNTNTDQQILRTTTTTNNYLTAEVYVVSGTSAASNVITFNSLPNRALGSGSFTVAATASSGLAVSFASSTPATCSVSGTTVALLAVGTCTIVATQPGNATYAAATPVSQSFAIGLAATSVALTASSTNITLGAPVTFTATVTGVNPTGVVTFFDGATALGTAALSGGKATLTTSALSKGSHSITASYGGDGANAPSVSPALAIGVGARPDPSLDPDVAGVVNAQVTAERRFAESQIDNVNRRLEQLHEEDQESVSMRLAFASPDQALGRDGQAIEQLRKLSDPSGRNSGATDGQRQYLSAFAGDPTRPASTHGSARFSIWTAGVINFGRQNYATPFGGLPKTDNRFTTNGVTAGIDTRVFDGFKAGVAFGFGNDATDIGNSGTRLDSRFASANLYSSWRVIPQTFIDMMVGYGRGIFNSTRFASVGGVFVDGRRTASEFHGSLSLTSEQRWGQFKFAPYARLQAIQMRFDAYTETGSPTWALAFNAMNASSVSGVLGLRASYGFQMPGYTLTPMARLEYRRAFDSSYTQFLNYADLAGTGAPNYTLLGRSQARNTVSGALGLRAETESLLSVNLEYQLGAAFGGGVQSQSVRLMLKQGF